MTDEIIPWEVDTRITGLQAEIDRLRRWKEEATIVLNQWDEVWEMAGKPGPLGSSKATSTKEWIEFQQSELDFYQANYTGDPD